MKSQGVRKFCGSQNKAETEEWITKTEFARREGRTVRYVYAQLKDANIRIQDGKIEYHETKAWWNNHIQKKYRNKKYRDSSAASISVTGLESHHTGKTGHHLDLSSRKESTRSGANYRGKGENFYQEEPIPLSFTDRKEKAIAELKELEVAQKRGELLEKAKVVKTVFQVGRQVRDIFLAIPRRLAGTLAVETDQRTIQVLLEQEIENALQVFEEVKL